MRMKLETTTAMFLVLASIAACKADDPAPAPADASVSPDGGTDPLQGCPSADDARVHYRDHDPNACADLTLDCTTDQNGFDNACGCGCIDTGDPLCPPVDDPRITWVSRDPAKCEATPPLCPMGETPFTGACGCGCTKPGS
jgi:hypothetical protein